jgi:hypothetical protein
MPCYEVREVQVEFKAQSKEILLEAVKKAGIYHYWNDLINILSGQGWAIDLEKQTATVIEGYEKNLNQVRRAYSEAVINEVAKRKKWLVKKMAGNKMQLKRY